MATPEQIPTDLVLEVGANLSPDRFMAVARAFFGYVQELSESITPEGAHAQWIVRVREGSTLIGLDPSPDASSEIVNAIYYRVGKGIDQLRRGKIDDFDLNDAATKYLRNLVELTDIRGRREKPVPMNIWVQRVPLSLDGAIADLIRKDVRADHHDHGTIEGRLETIQESFGTLQFQIRDPILRHRVKCYFPEELLPEVFEKFRKRVEVSGTIYFRGNGTPISIKAESIDALPDDKDLPSAADVRGILSN